jgi:transposase
LTEAQWQFLVTLLPTRKWRPGGPGRPPCDVRQVLNGILYSGFSLSVQEKSV